MAFEVPMDDIETGSVGGFDRVFPGSAHLEITNIDEDGGRKGEMIVRLEVLRHTVSNQEGKEIALYFAKDMSALARRKVHALAVATGLITKQQLDQHKANGTSPSYDFNPTVGRQVCANLEENVWEGKVSTRLQWDEIFHPADPKASHIPLLMAKIKTAKPPINLPANRNPDGAVKLAGEPTKKAATTTGKPQASNQAASVSELLG